MLVMAQQEKSLEDVVPVLFAGEAPRLQFAKPEQILAALVDAGHVVLRVRRKKDTKLALAQLVGVLATLRKREVLFSRLLPGRGRGARPLTWAASETLLDQLEGAAKADAASAVAAAAAAALAPAPAQALAPLVGTALESAVAALFSSPVSGRPPTLVDATQREINAALEAVGLCVEGSSSTSLYKALKTLVKAKTLATASAARQGPVQGAGFVYAVTLSAAAMGAKSRAEAERAATAAAKAVAKAALKPAPPGALDYPHIRAYWRGGEAVWESYDCNAPFGASKHGYHGHDFFAAVDRLEKSRRKFHKNDFEAGGWSFFDETGGLKPPERVRRDAAAVEAVQRNAVRVASSAVGATLMDLRGVRFRDFCLMLLPANFCRRRFLPSLLPHVSHVACARRGGGESMHRSGHRCALFVSAEGADKELSHTCRCPNPSHCCAIRCFGPALSIS